MEGLTGLFCNCEAHKGSLLQHGTLSSALNSFLSKQWLFFCHFLFDVDAQYPCRSVYKTHVLFLFSPYVLALQLTSSLSQFHCGLHNNPDSRSRLFLSNWDCTLSLPQNEGKWPLESLLTQRSLSAPVQFRTISWWECGKRRIKEISSSLSQQGQK